MSEMTQVLGTVAMEPKGEWDSETYYEKLNTVLYNDSTYMATEGVVGEDPSTSSKWQLIGGGVRREDIVDNLDSNDATKMLSAKQGKVLNEGKAQVFDTVALMKIADLKEGMTVQTVGYYSANDGGGATYKITDTQSNSEYQEELENGLYATLIIEDHIIPELFGAKGDGVADDTTAIQKAIDTSHKKNLTLNLLNKTYITSNSLNIYSNLEIDGNNATIKNETNTPIITSSSVVSRVNICSLNLVGANNEAYTDNNGIDLVCYYSKFNDLLISLCYNGIYIHHDGAGGTLVENRLSNIRVNNYYQYGIYLGALNNGKLTDGFLTNVICNGNSNSTTNQYGIYLGSAAGWLIDGVHIYGKNYNGIACSNGYYTNLSNIYIESFSNYGLGMGSTQLGCNVSNVQINHADLTNTGTAIRIEAAQYLPYSTHAGNLSNIRITRGSSTSGKSIQYTGAGYFNASNVIIDGTSRNIRNDCSGINFSMNGLIDSGDLIISKQKDGTVNAGIKAYKYKGFNPNSTTIDIALPEFTYNNQQAIIELTGIGGVWTSQSGLFYKGLIQLVRNNGGTLLARIHDIDNNVFTATPTVSLNSDTNVLTITVAPNTNVYGIMFYDIYFPNLT